MRKLDAFNPLMEWIEAYDGMEWKPGQFYLLKEGAPDNIKELFRVYNLFTRRNVGKVAIRMDDDNNIVGIEEDRIASEWEREQCENIMKLVEQGWLPKQWNNLTAKEQADLEKVILR